MLRLINHEVADKYHYWLTSASDVICLKMVISPVPVVLFQVIITASDPNYVQLHLACQ